MKFESLCDFIRMLSDKQFAELVCGDLLPKPPHPGAAVYAETIGLTDHAGGECGECTVRAGQLMEKLMENDPEYTRELTAKEKVEVEELHQKIQLMLAEHAVRGLLRN